MNARHLLGVSLIGLLTVLALADEPATTQPATTQPATQPTASQSNLTDDQVGTSIERAADFLLSKFDSQGKLLQIDGIANQVDHDGLEALCVYALLQAGHATDDPKLNIREPRMRQLIDQLKRCPLRSDPNVVLPVTFARAFRAAALSIDNRPEDHQILQEDVNWLVRAHREGAYTFDDNWPEEQVAQTSAPRNTGPVIVAGPVVAGSTSKLGEQKRTTVGPANYKKDNTVVNRRPDNSYNRQRDNFYVNRQPDNFYFGRDLCIPSRGKAVVGTPQVNPPPANNPPPTAPPDSSTRLGVYQPRQGVATTRPAVADDDHTPAIWDNSNSQLAAFGVYSAAQAGIEVPKTYWQAVDGHWVRCQQDDGQWGYSEFDPAPRVSMTCAGIASFLVTLDRLSNMMDPKQLGVAPMSPRMAKAMAWLCDSDNSINMLGPLTRYVSYNLFTLERVGLDGGNKYFGNHDWYRELSARVISVQWPNGAFGRNFDGYDTVVESAFTLAFLSKGRSPVMMEKLQFDGDWSNRTRDVANVSRFASRALERPINWEVVQLNRDWHDWLDTSLMYIASDRAPNFTDADIAKLKSFIDAGGMLFTHADGDSATFNDYIEKTLATKLYPNNPMQDVPADDAIYSTQYQLTGKAIVPLRGIKVDSRWVLVHSAKDIAISWQNRTEKGLPQNFQLATNLFVYAEGKNAIRNRIAPMPSSTNQ